MTESITQHSGTMKESNRGVPGDSVGLPNVQLAVLSGTTHITLVDRTQWLVPMITGFLDVSDPV